MLHGTMLDQRRMEVYVFTPLRQWGGLYLPMHVTNTQALPACTRARTARTSPCYVDPHLSHPTRLGRKFGPRPANLRGSAQVSIILIEYI